MTTIRSSELPWGFHSCAYCWLMWLFLTLALHVPATAHSAVTQITVNSPDGRNAILIRADAENFERVQYAIDRNGGALFAPSDIGPVLAEGEPLGIGSRVVDTEREKLDETFVLLWGKTREVHNRCERAVVTLETRSHHRWQIELRAYDEGVAFRYRLLRQEGLTHFELRDEVTHFQPVGEPAALFNMLDGFTTSHESLYHQTKLNGIPENKLLEMPLLLTWPKGQAAAITEARVRGLCGDVFAAIRCLVDRPS